MEAPVDDHQGLQQFLGGHTIQDRMKLHIEIKFSDLARLVKFTGLNISIF